MMKKHFFIIGLIGITVGFVFNACTTVKPIVVDNTVTPKNVLFIMVDDLRPELSMYGKTQIISPNIDGLAATGVTFERAYCNVPVCGASRASLLTGKRPTAKRFMTYHASIKKEMPGVPTMAKYFKSLGYTTVSNNKIAHMKQDDPGSWDQEWYPYVKGWRDYITPENIALEAGKGHGYAFESPDVEDAAYYDGKTANKSIEDLKRFKKEGKPFFLAVGFVKPHLPFNAPKKYWNLYDKETIKLPENSVFPESAPQVANHKWGELRAYKGIPKKGAVPTKMAKKLIHGYYASISYVDAQIGKVIKTLDDLGLRENTSIVFIGDHGWSLSEHGLWAKHSNFEVALRVPMIFSDAQVSKGSRTDSMAELIDVYPTLCELTNNPIPSHVDGVSLVENLKSPLKITRNQARSRWKNGETLIAGDYFYTEWKKKGKVTDVMLYNHSTDPNENRNLAVESAYKKVVDSLGTILNRQITAYKLSELKN